MNLIPLIHNYDKPLKEVITFSSSQILAEDQSEQSTVLGTKPFREFSYESALLSLKSFIDLQGLRFKASNIPKFLFPQFTDFYYIEREPSNSFAIPVSGDFVEIRNNDKVLIFKNENIYEIATVSSFFSGTLFLTSNTNFEYGYDSYIVPLREGYVKDIIQFETIEKNIKAYELEFIAEKKFLYEEKITNPILTINNSYKNKFLFNFEKWINNVSTSINYRNNNLSNDKFVRIYSNSVFPFLQQSHELNFLTRNDISVFFGILDKLKGSHKTFFKPSFNNDFILAENYFAGGTSIRVYGGNYFTNYSNNEGRKEIWIKTVQGREYRNTILSSTLPDSEGIETLFLQNSFSDNILIEDVRIFSFLLKVRLNEPSITLDWESPFKASTNLVFREVYPFTIIEDEEPPPPGS